MVKILWYLCPSPGWTTQLGIVICGTGRWYLEESSLFQLFVENRLLFTSPTDRYR